MRAKQFVFRSARKIPFVRKKIEGEVENALVGIEHDLLKHNSEWKVCFDFPISSILDILSVTVRIINYSLLFTLKQCLNLLFSGIPQRINDPYATCNIDSPIRAYQRKDWMMTRFQKN